ncbi:NnrUfamily protein [Methylocella silvestris BL2]|uniref:NnrUfamily protein n=1 Tax=Methylocella silvestris (strain DSM 15510 / CIP 108128 / LMG 27833 / NCIMB 13906 / BL2) TaxID=395965 RepID=B8EJI2_METSB|nr:NnrU family protein [Methylocella silvestris]ACK52674.1 NnrUfamily protein [Methylocella silvestris BL2]
MLILIVGLIVFLGVHVLTTMRETRVELIGRFGERTYKLAYAAASVVGFVLIVWGFSRYRAHGLIPVWAPPEWTRHITMLLMWLAFIALAAMGKTPSRIRGWLRHPMLVAIKIWALAHLLVNGDLGGMILFCSFLAFAVYDRIAVKRRGDVGAPRLAEFTRADVVTLVGGTVAYVVMIFLHPILIGVPVLR